MASRIKLGFQYFKKTFGILKAKKSLLLFPLLSGLFSLLAFVIILLPAGSVLFVESLHERVITNSQWGIFTGFFVLFAFVASFIIFFFNGALTACALQVLQNQEYKISNGIKAAFKRIHVIFLWSLVATSFGLLMHLLENASRRYRVLENIIAGILGLAWSICTLFIVPTLMVENLGPIKAFKRSSQLMKDTWGTSLVSTGSMGIVVLICFAIACVPFGLSLHFNETGYVLLDNFIITIVLVLIVLLFSTTLQTVLRAGLYLFATGNTNIAGYDTELLKNAFRSKIK